MDDCLFINRNSKILVKKNPTGIFDGSSLVIPIDSALIKVNYYSPDLHLRTREVSELKLNLHKLLFNMKFSYCPLCASSLEKNKENYLSCVSDHCQYIHYDNPTPVVGAIVEYENDTIVLVQNVGWPPSWYALVTGFLEKNEHPDEAVLREIKDETGLDAEIISFRGHYTFERMNQIIMIYHVKAFGAININRTEIADYKIVPISKVKSWPQATGVALQEWLEERRGY